MRIRGKGKITVTWLLLAVLSAGVLFSGCGRAGLPYDIAGQIAEKIGGSVTRGRPGGETAERGDEGDGDQGTDGDSGSGGDDAESGKDPTGKGKKKRTADQEQFDALADEIFKDAVTSSLINLHFTVTDPEGMGLSKPEEPYGEVSLAALKEDTATYQEALDRLEQIKRSRLDPDSQLDYDILRHCLETEVSAAGLEAYAQPLAPTIGTQAQLPILLAEYAFYTEEDIEDYFSLLSGLQAYYGQILDFEREKADLGLMMTDEAIDRVLDSCRPYLADGESCVLAGTFAERLDSLEGLTDQQKAAYTARHAELISTAFVPAYEQLVQGLEALKGTGRVEGGLCGYPEGREYYRYLVYSSTATSCKSVDTLQKSIEKRLKEDHQEIVRLLRAQPELVDQLADTSFALTDPEEILPYLQEAIRTDYPEPICMDYSLHYVPEALEEVLSPAFYLTPPIDHAAVNPIYINQGSHAVKDQLFTTLAHEGYPGHLYQSSYFVSKDPAPIRHALSFGAYTEGWATYVEYDAYRLDPDMSPAMAQLLALDSSINLGIHAYIDIMVNDKGWKVPEIHDFITDYYNDPDMVTSTALYEAMIDNPANYREYHAGYLEFSDMRERVQKALGDRFQPIEFHRFLLDIGPAPFPVIRDRLEDQVREQKR